MGLTAAAGATLNALHTLALRRRIPGLSLGDGAFVDRRARIVVKGAQDRITLGREATLHHGVYLSTFGAFCELGEGAKIGPYTVLYAQGGITIGAFVSIGPHCVLSSGGHAFDRPGLIRAQGFTRAPIVIGRGVWLGATVTVTEGVTVGEDAILAAGAVVTSDVPAGAIVGGVPARVLRCRTGYEAISDGRSRSMSA